MFCGSPWWSFILCWRWLVTITLLRIGGLAFLIALADDVHVLMPSLMARMFCAFTLVSDIGGLNDDIQWSVPICVLLAKPQVAILTVHRLLNDNDCPLVVYGE